MKPFIISAIAALSLQSVATNSVLAEPSGEYLAGRQARYSYDFDAAARYFTQALLKDTKNQAILEQAVVSLLSLGEFGRALPIALRMDSSGMKSQVGSLTFLTTFAQAGDYEGLLVRIDENKGIGPLGDGLLKAWAQVGKGDMTSALATFDAVTKEPGMRDLALYHKALALATVGDYETTVDILSGKAAGDVQYTRRGLVAWAEALSQLERYQEAKDLLNDSFTTPFPPDIQALYDKLDKEEPVPFSVVTTPSEGIAEVFFSLGQALMDGAGNDFVLMFARAAEYINPHHIDAILMSAELLVTLERYELASEVFKKVPRDHLLFQNAELGRAQALNNAGKPDEAIEVMTDLTETYPDVSMIAITLGDLYRENERFAEATTAYDKAIDLYKKDGEVPWFAYYSRAVTLERTDKWDAAEKDFRAALKENPDQPQVLNYLGYAMVEKRVNLDEALGFIKRAVELEPDSGYIVDSLGWVQYQLGDYAEAAKNLERAAELMPVDPVVNDHLGDALWKVGRKTEAEFQWRRALSFIDPNKPSPDIDPERVRQKLSLGLDAPQKTEQKAEMEAEGAEKTEKKEKKDDDS